MTKRHDVDDAIARVLTAATSNFVELTKMAGLDPAKDFRHANLEDIDFSGCNLSGFDFSGSSFEGATFVNARISGATFSTSAQLNVQLRSAIDAEEVLGDRRPRRRGRRGVRRGRGATEAPFLPESFSSSDEDETFSILRQEERNDVFEVFFEEEESQKEMVVGRQSVFERLEETRAWLDSNPDSIEAFEAIHRLGEVHCGSGEIIHRSYRWLESNSATEEGGYVFIVLLKFSKARKVQQLALRWIEGPPKDRRLVPDVLKLLLRASEWDETVAKALDWLDANPVHGRGSNLVLPALIKSRSRDPLVRDRVLTWIENQPDTRSADLLAMLLKTDPTDSLTLERCLSCLDRNPISRFTASLLLAALKFPELESQIKERAFRWLEGNCNWPHAAVIVDHLSRYCESDEDGRQFLLRWIETVDPERRLEVSRRLSQASVLSKSGNAPSLQS